MYKLISQKRLHLRIQFFSWTTVYLGKFKDKSIPAVVKDLLIYVELIELEFRIRVAAVAFRSRLNLPPSIPFSTLTKLDTVWMSQSN